MQFVILSSSSLLTSYSLKLISRFLSFYRWQETEQLKIDCDKEEQDMKQRQTQERRRLPRVIRGESKTRKEMFKKRIHIEHPEYKPDQESQAIKEVKCL